MRSVDNFRRPGRRDHCSDRIYGRQLKLPTNDHRSTRVGRVVICPITVAECPAPPVQLPVEEQPAS
jgi:hypothetical protein